ncbi:MAG TPA: cytochrome b/b6 domain-containing protein [Steroidobacteraceae bacterium]|nr:cytochrome b/b6 domain-containing protein [Steroidobacteraceae bacterium]HRX88002.1 cytochrome b/b6 domain-containing protein [Steroidobacteraceae bacterium]
MNEHRYQRGYRAPARLLHWGIALLVVAQIVIALRAWRLPAGDDKYALLFQHRSLGLTIFVLMVVRLGWRWANDVPPLPDTMHAASRALARFNQYLLYGLLLLLPLSGLAMSQSAGTVVSWFGLFDLPVIVAADEALLARMKLVHLGLNTVLFAALALHLIGALRHWLWLKDGVFSRMLTGR